MSQPTEYLQSSYSSLNVFANCARNYEFNKLYPTGARDSGYAADTGKALHAGYQDFLVHGDDESAIKQFMLSFPWEDEFFQAKDDRSFDACLATLEALMIYGRMDEYELAMIRRPLNAAELAANAIQPTFDPSGIVVPAIEVPFEIRFKGITLPDGRGVSFIGFIDAILRNKMNGRYRTCDIKTSRLSLLDATPKYKFDTQQIPYGIVVDHVAQGEVESFEVLYLDCYIDLLAPRINLYPFQKSRVDLQEWCFNKIIQFQLIQRYMEADFFPRTDGGCLKFNKPCKFMDVCESRDRPTITTWLEFNNGGIVNREPHRPWIIVDIDMEI